MVSELSVEIEVRRAVPLNVGSDIAKIDIANVLRCTLQFNDPPTTGTAGNKNALFTNLVLSRNTIADVVDFARKEQPRGTTFTVIMGTNTIGSIVVE